MTGNTETNSSGDVISATPSQFGGNPDRPVEKVSWEDIQVFLTRLNEQQAENLPNGWAYVLPTEAQWEYACRAGTTTAYSWGDSISASDANWNHGNDANQTENVGQYSANPWGFFDMHGNVWEWTADWYAAYSSGAQTDPEGPATGSNRVLRGGSWSYTGTNLRSATATTRPQHRRQPHRLPCRFPNPARRGQPRTGIVRGCRYPAQARRAMGGARLRSERCAGRQPDQLRHPYPAPWM